LGTMRASKARHSQNYVKASAIRGGSRQCEEAKGGSKSKS
jgi:hypothetical protein